MPEMLWGSVSRNHPWNIELFPKENKEQIKLSSVAFVSLDQWCVSVIYVQQMITRSKVRYKKWRHLLGST